MKEAIQSYELSFVLPLCTHINGVHDHKTSRAFPVFHESLDLISAGWDQFICLSQSVNFF